MSSIDLATWLVLESFIPLMSGVAVLGFHHYMIYWVGSGRGTVADLAASVKWVWLCAPVLVVLQALVCIVLLPSLDLYHHFLYLVLLVLSDLMFLLAQFSFRAEARPLNYAIAVWVKCLVLLSSLLCVGAFDVRLKLSLYFSLVIFSNLLATSLACLVGYKTRRTLRVKSIDALRAVDMITYGMPIMLSVVATALAANGDRIVTYGLVDTKSAADYLILAKLGGLVAFASAPINLWWPQVRSAQMRAEDGGQVFFSSVLPILVVYYSCMIGIVWVVSLFAFPYFAGAEASLDKSTLMLLIISGGIMGMCVPLNVGTLRPGKTIYVLVVTLIAALFSVSSSLVLVPEVGVIGAAASVLGAQVLTMSLTFYFSQKFHYVLHDYRKLGQLLGLTVLYIAQLYYFSDEFLFQVPLGGCYLFFAFLLVRSNLLKIFNQGGAN